MGLQPNCSDLKVLEINPDEAMVLPQRMLILFPSRQMLR
jgi:hypothetical protein